MAIVIDSAPRPRLKVDVERASADWDGWVRSLPADQRATVDAAFLNSTPESLAQDRMRFLGVAHVSQAMRTDPAEVSESFESLYLPLHSLTIGKPELGKDVNAFVAEAARREKESRLQSEMFLGTRDSEGVRRGGFIRRQQCTH